MPQKCSSVLSSHKPSILSMYPQNASVLSSHKPSILSMYRIQKKNITVNMRLYLSNRPLYRNVSEYKICLRSSTYKTKLQQNMRVVASRQSSILCTYRIHTEYAFVLHRSTRVRSCTKKTGVEPPPKERPRAMNRPDQNEKWKKSWLIYVVQCFLRARLTKWLPQRSLCAG
jgi:hypothetical protein